MTQGGSMAGAVWLDQPVPSITNGVSSCESDRADRGATLLSQGLEQAPRRRKRLTMRISERFGGRGDEIRDIVGDVMREYLPSYDAGVLVIVSPHDEYGDGYWRRRRGARVVPTGVAYRDGWISMPHTMPVSAVYLIELWVPMDPAAAAWPYFDWGSPRRWTRRNPPSRRPRAWPVHRYDDWREELVSIVAHEAKHVLDYSRHRSGHPLPHHPEVGAERAAHRAVEAYRRKRR